MKLSKILTISAMVAIVAFNAPVAQAESCDGGGLVTGTNGHVYCLSKNDMNWWSTYAWCEAQGRHLASIYEACPAWDGLQGDNKCANLTGVSNNPRAFSSTAQGKNDACVVLLGNGMIGCGIAENGSIIAGTGRAEQNKALCY